MDRVETNRLLHVISSASADIVAKPYLHWDDLRYKSPPADLTSEEWWLGTKMARRSMYRALPLYAEDRHPFVYALPDVVLAAIEEIGRDSSGHIGVNEAVTNSTTRDRYLVSSLIEEAITSSQLEGASTTRRVAKDMIRSGRAPKDRSERMILNNYRAMRRIGELRNTPITPEIVCELHRIVTEGTLDNPDAAGRLQRADEDRVSIYGSGDVLLHEPPPADSLPKRLDDLCRFANGESDSTYLPPALRAISIHFMVGYDHYFEDGNGRTARALFYWSMLNQGYWLTEFLSISKILKAAPSKYATSFLLTESDDSDLTYFFIYQLKVIQRAITELHTYLARKMSEVRDLQRTLASTPGQFNHRQLALLEHATRNPDAHYTMQSHARSHNTSLETGRHDLLALTSKGLLRRQKIGRMYYYLPVDGLTDKLRDLATG
jgi:Fic family protein